MEQKICLSNMFPDYEPSEELRSALSQAAIVAADIDMEDRSVYAVVHSETYIPQRLLNQAAREIGQLYGLRVLTLDSTHPASELQKIETEELMNLFVSRNSMTRGSLAGARWEWDGNALTIHLKANGRNEILKLVPEVERELRERFGTDMMITVEAGNALEGQALFDAMVSMRTQALGDAPSAAKKSVVPVKKAAPPSDAIYGKPFKGNAVSMDSLSMDMGTVIVEGRVFNVDQKEL